MLKNKKYLAKIGICQINLNTGDIEGNSRKITEYIKRCQEENCDIVVFPELSITGPLAKDLFLNGDFLRDNISALKSIAQHCSNIVAIVGFANKVGDKTFNSAAVISNKKIVHVSNKICLQDYIFGEKKYFSNGDKLKKIRLGRVSVVVTFANDLINLPNATFDHADYVLALGALPFISGNQKNREKIFSLLSKTQKTNIVLTNLVGGFDGIIFDGASIACDETGKIVSRAKQFEENLSLVDFSSQNKIQHKIEKYEEIYKALCLGLKDYVTKNNFSKVALGLSGGIDSALVAAIAVDSLGKDNVKCFSLPSKYTSKISKIGAEKLAKNLGIDLIEIKINPIFESYLKALKFLFKGLKQNIAEENLQARIRGTLLMTISNKFGYLLLATGNKSESSAGYATLYGDTAGGLALIGDIPKTIVYKLAEYRNTISDVIPKLIIKRAPTAELKKNQKDQDTLPKYEILDKIISDYFQYKKSPSEIIKSGIPKSIVNSSIKMFHSSQFKRAQCPPVIKIFDYTFGLDLQLPITNKYIPS